MWVVVKWYHGYIDMGNYTMLGLFAKYNDFHVFDLNVVITRGSLFHQVTILT